MQYILSSQHRQVLGTFASSNTLVALDFDGTLAPIVRDRKRAAIPQSTRNLLTILAKLYPCVVISGRSRKDVRRRLGGIKIKEIVGNHGIEPWSASQAMEIAVRRWVPLLQDKLRQLRHAAIENKRFSVAIHYRDEPRKQQVRAAIAAAARELGAVRLVGGKQVLNILPAGAPHKGLALERALLKLRCTKAIYIGDDDTDEDVFALPSRGRFLTIRVGRSRGSLARYYIRSQGEIDRLIRRLVELRSASAGLASR
ncbi:MAG: trehalose-phosphatase [Acidobacteriia bacterium]|nr:trehalose-phosphatase [Terriglobia bacterium]